jgi:hypothetical protein
MKAYLILTILIVLFRPGAIAQREVNNSYLFDIDEPFQFNKHLIRHNYRMVELFNCPNTIFNEQLCTCTKREAYDTSGRLVQLISGNDLRKNKINYSVTYQLVTDSVCEIITRFSAAYVDSMGRSSSLFTQDTIINQKSVKQFLYPREKNNDIIMRSILQFDDDHTSLAKKISRFDVKGKLTEIYYPLGNIRPLKVIVDTSVNGKFKTISYKQVFNDNEFDDQISYNDEGLILERKFVNIRNGRANFDREINVYNDRKKLIRKLTVDENNAFIREETFFYSDSILTKYILTSNPEDSVPDVRKIYDREGNLIELFEGSTASHKNDWLYKYYFENQLQQRTDYYHNSTFWKTTFFKYK